MATALARKCWLPAKPACHLPLITARCVGKGKPSEVDVHGIVYGRLRWATMKMNTDTVIEQIIRRGQGFWIQR